ncbi:MAG: hypothetical protein ACXAEF_02230 [Candidatus Thorarchaeota archaeon]
MSPTKETQQSQDLVLLEATLEPHNIPTRQPTTSLILSHIGFPRLGSMAKTIRKGNGIFLLATRIILATLSSIIFIIANQQDYTEVILSGNPWLPLTEVIGSPLDLVTVLLNTYILVPSNLILGQLILLYLDLPMYWLLKSDSRRLWFWVITSTLLWFIVAVASGLFVEGAITWGLSVFPEGASQLHVAILGGVCISGMIELMLLFAWTREVIRLSRPKFMQIEGRFMAVRDYITKRSYMKKPFSSIFKQAQTTSSQFFFIRESLMNWIRVLILIGVGIGIFFVLPDFGVLSTTPLIGSVFLTLVGLVVLGLTLLFVISGLRKGLRTFWSAFLFITFVIIVEGMFLSLFCGFNFALASTIVGLLVLAILNLQIRKLVGESPGILNPIYFRYLLTRMNSDEVQAYIGDTLNQLSKALPQQL